MADGTALRQLVCDVCGDAFETKNKVRRRCSPRCNNWAYEHPGVPMPKVGPCAYCGGKLPAGAKLGSLYCSKTCKGRADNGILRPAPATCAGCGNEFLRTHGSRIYCTDACRCRTMSRRRVQRDPEAVRRTRRESAARIARGERRRPARTDHDARCIYCYVALEDPRGRVCYTQTCRTQYKRAIYFRSLGLSVPDMKCTFCGQSVSNAKALVCGEVECRRAYKREAARRWVAGLEGELLERFKLRKANDSHRRRLAMDTAECREISLREWRRLLDRYRHRCAYCGSDEDMTMDHVIPLVRGGRHAIGNIVPACWSCNCSKKERLLVEWRHTKRGR